MGKRCDEPGVFRRDRAPGERRVEEECRPGHEQAPHPEEEDPEGARDHAATFGKTSGSGASAGGSACVTTGAAFSCVDMVGAGSERSGSTALYVWPLHVAKKWKRG